MVQPADAAPRMRAWVIVSFLAYANAPLSIWRTKGHDVRIKRDCRPQTHLLNEFSFASR
jgi:hypothetical protein